MWIEMSESLMTSRVNPGRGTKAGRSLTSRGGKEGFRGPKIPPSSTARRGVKVNQNAGFGRNDVFPYSILR